MNVFQYTSKNSKNFQIDFALLSPHTELMLFMSKIKSFFVALFHIAILTGCAFLLATTFDIYNEAVADIVRPFNFTAYAILVLLIVLYLLNFFFPGGNRTITSLSVIFGISTMISMTLVLAAGFLPCSYDLNHDPIGASAVIEKAIFCPSYSTSAYIGIGITFFVGLMLTLVSFRYRKKKSSRRKSKSQFENGKI